MLESLFTLNFSLPATAAVWATIASFAASLLLLLYTLELRVHRQRSERRRARIIARWRPVIAEAIAGAADSPASIPKLPRRERREFLRLWNYTRNMIEGAAAERLIGLAHDLALVDFVREQARRSHFGDRLSAIQALGHLRDRQSFDELLQAVEDSNPLVSITAAEALADMDPGRAVAILIPLLAHRREWPRTHVFRLLQKAGSEPISEPLFRAIRAASDADATYLLQFAEIAEYEVRDAIAAEMVRSRTDPNLLAAALKAASGYGEMPRLATCLTHDTSYVRMQAVELIGRMDRVEHVPLLEDKLEDPEWWVRYRAANALVGLSGMTGEQLADILDRQHDPYAIDILEQVMAEHGIR